MGEVSVVWLRFDNIETGCLGWIIYGVAPII
jgi:hypothetical protein